MSRSKPSLACAIVLSALVARAATAGSMELDLRRLHTRTGADTVAVLKALNGAQRKLRSPKCRELMTDFRDGAGRPLDAALQALEMEAADYITLLVVSDGGERGAGEKCRRSNVVAVTSPGSRVVYVCGTSFRSQAAGARENTLIHEMLHSLGLGENPPTPAQIDGQIWRRCGG